MAITKIILLLVLIVLILRSTVKARTVITNLPFGHVNMKVYSKPEE